MPRKGWSTVQVPDGWLQLIRGPTNQKKSHGQGPSPVKSRRTSQVAQPPPAEGQRGPTPEEVISNAHARVTKLEAPMAAVGETDPTFGALQEALKKAQSQVQARPVADPIASTKVFIERAKKRVTVCREEVSRAQELFAQAQTKAFSPKNKGWSMGRHTFGGSSSGECDERGGTTSDSPRQFRPRIGRVAGLRPGIATREPRFAIPVAVHRRTRRRRATAQTAQKLVKFCSRSGALESRSGGSDTGSWTKFAIHEWRPVRIVSQNGDTDRQRRGKFAFESVQPTLMLMGVKTARVQARYGMRGCRVGEASHPGPPSDQVLSTVADSLMGVEHALEFDLTHQDSDSEMATVSCSDTESCVEQPLANRRLRLLWDRSAPDPNIQVHPEARAVEGLFRTLAARIGSVPAGSEIPRAIHSQRWSPINVPLIWSASGSGDSTPALDWLIMAAGRIVEPISLCEGRMSASEAAGTGWSALRRVCESGASKNPAI